MSDAASEKQNFIFVEDRWKVNRDVDFCSTTQNFANFAAKFANVKLGKETIDCECCEKKFRSIGDKSHPEEIFMEIERLYKAEIDEYFENGHNPEFVREILERNLWFIPLLSHYVHHREIILMMSEHLLANPDEISHAIEHCWNMMRECVRESDVGQQGHHLEWFEYIKNINAIFGNRLASIEWPADLNRYAKTE